VACLGSLRRQEKKKEQSYSAEGHSGWGPDFHFSCPRDIDHDSTHCAHQDQGKVILLL
jgi:hypothetical protein